MKSFLNLLRWFLGGSVFLGALVTAVPYVVAQKAPVVLPMGAVIIVRIDEQVTGKTHTSGALVKASVARDVVIDNVPVIKIGTPVEVSIAQASKAGAVGQAGAVGINIESTQTVDNQTVFLRGVFSPSPSLYVLYSAFRHRRDVFEQSCADIRGTDLPPL